MAVIIPFLPFRQLVYGWRRHRDDVEQIGEPPAVWYIFRERFGKSRVAYTRRTKRVQVGRLESGIRC